MWENFKKMVRHNQGLATMIVVVGCLAFCTYGCESQVSSIVNPTVKVTRAEAAIELETLLAKAELQSAAFDKEDEIKTAIFNIGLVIAEGGTINPVGAVVTLAGLLGIGAVVDNRKKDGLIKGLKPPA